MSEIYNKLGSHAGEIPIIKFIKRDGTTIKAVSGEGDVGFDGLSIITLKIQEGIDQFMVHGELIVRDYGRLRSGNLFSKGYDYVEIRGKSNHDKGGTEYSLYMEVVNVVSVEEGKVINGGWDVIKLVLVQYPAYRNLLTWRTSGGYSDIIISDIIKDIFKKYISYDNQDGNFYKIVDAADKDTIEPTKGKLDSFCIPFWSPYKTINYLKRYAINMEGSAGYHTWIDIENTFHFRSLEHILNSNKPVEVKLKEVRTASAEGARTNSDIIIKDYYSDIGSKQYYKIGLSGGTVERFNWEKKKQFATKLGYKKRPSPEVNPLYEKEEDINNMYGYHEVSPYRWTKEEPLLHQDISKGLLLNQMITASGAQCDTHLHISGVVDEENKIFAGRKILVTTEMPNTHENVFELQGEWFVRTVVHSWTAKYDAYKQLLGLSRIGAFEHQGGGIKQ